MKPEEVETSQPKKKPNGGEFSLADRVENAVFSFLLRYRRIRCSEENLVMEL